jgi:hypothetical protein
MVKFLALTAVACVLVGCEAQSVLSEPDSAPIAGPVPNLRRTAVALYAEQGMIYVGDSWTDAQSAVPEPKDAVTFADLPARFEKPYQGRGWEGATQGFGVILYKDVIASAMLQNERATLEEYTTSTNWYDENLPKAQAEMVISGDLKYRFWEFDGQRVMVLAQSKPNGTMRLTTAIGDDRVMDALGITPAAARHDAAAVSRILRERKEAALKPK